MQRPQTPAAARRLPLSGQPTIIFKAQSIAILQIQAGIEQGRDPLRIDLEDSHFLPEPFGGRTISTPELGIRQLLSEQHDQRLLFADGERSPAEPGGDADAGGGRRAAAVGSGGHGPGPIGSATNM